MAILTVQEIVRTGLNPTYSAAEAGGDKVPNADNMAFVHVKNGDASAHTVTATSTATASPGLAPSDLVVSVPASEERMIGPFPTSSFNNPQNQVDLTYDAVTNVTIAAIRFNAAS